MRAAVTPVTGADLVPTAERLLAEGYRVALVAAHDDAAPAAALRVVYLFTAPGDRRVELRLSVDRADPRVPSLAAASFPAGRFERELHDLYGIQPVDHPLPRRLVRHLHWPKGWYPMRRDAGAPPPFTDTDGPFPFLTVEGPGVYEIPVGPVHAGLIEPGHFRFSVVGESIIKLKIRLWYTHRGVERLFEGRPVADGVSLAERISGDSSVGHAVAYCRAVEDALDLPVPPQVERVRAVLLELERLYNHVGDLGALCNDVGHGIVHAHTLRIRERLLRLAARTSGHRLLRGGVTVGGAALRSVPDRAEIAEIAADVRRIVDVALANSLVADRFTGTAVLTTQQAADLGTLGTVARASGVGTDARAHHPTGALADLGFALGDLPDLPTQGGGDVLARFRQRVAEIETSAVMLDALLAVVSPGQVGSPAPGPGAGVAGDRDAAAAGALKARALEAGAVAGVGIVEGWRGTITHRVELDPAGTLTRVKVVDPSFFNWPALPVALANTIVPDFPLVNKSFNLSYAGNDL